MDKYMEKVDDDPNWSHQTYAGAESGLTATVATGLICPLVSIWKSISKNIYRKACGKVYRKGIWKSTWKNVYGQVYG